MPRTYSQDSANYDYGQNMPKVFDPSQNPLSSNNTPSPWGTQFNFNPSDPTNAPVPGSGLPNSGYQGPPSSGLPGAKTGPTGSNYGVPGTSGISMPPGIDPRLAQLFQQYGKTPTDRGTGPTDWQYWQDLLNKPGADAGYLLGRLGQDLAGTGTDVGGGGVPSAGQGSMGSLSPFSVPGASSALASYRPMSDQLMNFITGRGTGQITDASIPNLQVSPTDPIIKAQTDAYRAEQERGVRSALSRAAEGSAEGAIPGAQAATGRSLEEKAGQATSGYEAQLMGNELQARRQELQQALSGALGYMTSEQEIAAQDELARIGLALQESQFGRSLGERAYEFDTGQYNTLGGF